MPKPLGVHTSRPNALVLKAFAGTFLGVALLPSAALGDMSAVADGQPWKAVLAGGQTVQLRFQPDGVVRARGV
ncbi:MAG: hypothetical protein AAF311_12735, partial [Pseudomonadota bacterium]